MFGTNSIPELYLQTRATRLPTSYFSLSLLLILLGLMLDSATGQNYSLSLDTFNSPPASIPKDPKDLVYSVPLNQLTSRPITVFVLDNTGGVATSLNDSIVFHATTMDKSQNETTDVDSWRDSGGKLCQWSNPDEDVPYRLNRNLYYTVCGSNVSTTTLIAKVINGKILLDWLTHVHPNGSLPPDDRFIRIEIPQLNVSTDTNLFKITEPAARLNITQQPPENITANTGFNISAEILGRNGSPLTVGLDSVAFVELTVSYDYKVFYKTMERNMILKSTKVHLGGQFVTTYQATRDLVIRQRASAGKVFFTDVRILDSVYDMTLNLTMFMTTDPFLRIPNCAECYSDLSLKFEFLDSVFYHLPPKHLLNKLLPLAFTNRFTVLPQTFHKLKFTSNFKGTGKMKIIRNFPIPGPLTIESQDINGNRIYSGSDSNMPLEVKAIPSDVCISSDYSVISYEGVATFSGSICDIRSSIFLVFYSRKDPTVNVTSQELKAIGTVRVAHFDHFEFTGAGTHISPHINSFVRFAAEDINNGIICGVLRQFNMEIVLVTIETKNDIEHTIKQYKSHNEIAEDYPHYAIRAAILSGSSKIIEALIGELINTNTTQISLDEKGNEYTGLPLFNRVCWNSRQIYRSFYEFCLERHWTRMIILRTSNTILLDAVKEFARRMKVDLSEVVIDHEKVEWKARYPDINQILKQAMRKVMKKEIKVIACFANHTQIPAILRIAKKEGLSSQEGYQWVFVSQYAWGFPFNNSLSCDLFPVCTTVFGGTVLFTETYNTSFLRTNDWERVLSYYYSADKSLYHGLKSVYPNTDTSARMALGYDAMWLYALALTNIASKRLTATTERVIKELRRVTIKGLSGTLKLNANGDRHGFMANVRILDAHKPKEPMEKVASLYKYIVRLNDKQNFEYVYEDDKDTLSTNKTILSPRLPISPIYNIRSFKSKSGRISKTNLRLVRYSNESWPPKNIMRLEKLVPSFTCNPPCGKATTQENMNIFDRGICHSMNKCKCFKGYFGTYCENKVCTCSNGRCEIPDVCICEEGYTGKKCNIPICDGGCKHGKCVEPNECKCFKRFWVGHKCHIHIALILAPMILLLILFVYLSYTCFNFIRRRIERASALSNLQWLVDWQEVIIGERSMTVVRSKVSTGTFASGTTYTWKKRKWYVKNIHCNTIDLDDENVRLEMVELISLNHQNLITYGGACLVHPNVCFLVEPAQKGSLDEVLLNDTIHLDWNFRSSFLKDICRGMNFLHTKSKVGSHGRLKSSNCLLDNHWCIRITDFGAPAIRHGSYVIEKTEEEKAEDYNAAQEALLWTAPELLGTATCLNDVRLGTKEGDVYSFAIIVTEIATRDAPFEYERDFLSTCELIDLIVNPDSPAVQNERETWESLDSDSKLVRPYIYPKYLPEGKTVQKNFRKMLDDLWPNDPLERISFQKIKTVLDLLFPAKKELMDNLIHLLESYSKNLEQMVIEQTDALEIEKTKVENIVSQMLPKKVIDGLKNGKKVEPENFECVTVYYSDIVGFTAIAKSIQPLQVVDLLNHLYSVFDNILAEYDVYKVETIGDAYVVSSGVPILNANLHAGEIATASLDIMSAIMMLEIPHLTSVKLQMRVGINTGPVVAGVVGLKMPRYTLFGDTMQIASTMESTSKSMRIQMSGHTVNILKELGGYSMIYRGNTNVCGKNIDTYWLTGKMGYVKPLPVFEDD